ncbi:T9SS type A sorting domain-containing protein [Rummeliibacillus pycnus]|uniref:T9SS type A sorting domain-containing protein n=1 Tax=Rummeliibacillus pycnus TaxID=101070 RepID=UPI000C9B7248|nr:T9SS type A sorting domain-containing protein [Rummeliibacillus pycnus]
MKRVIQYCSLVLLFTLCAVGFNISHARAAAGNLAFNTWKTEFIKTVQGETYTLNIPKDGVVTLEMKNNLNAKWDMVLTNKNQKELLTMTSTTYILNGNSTKKEIGIPKGTYTLQIKGNWGNFDTTASLFQVKYSARSDFEKEDNTLLQDANAISLNKAYYGNISSSNDQDSYKFTVRANSNITLNLSNHKDVQWDAVIYDASEREYLRLRSKDANSGKVTKNVGLSRGTYYVVVRQMDSPKYANERYNFKVSTNTNQNVEQENNDSMSSATVIPFATNYTGIISTTSDFDYYRAEIKKNNTYTVFSLRNKANTSWLVTIYNEMGGEVGKFTTKNTNSGSSSFSTYLPQGLYYVRVTDNSNTVNKPYTINVYTKTKSAAPSTKNISVTNKKGAKDTVTVKKVSKQIVVRIYNSKGKLLKKSTATSTTVKVSKLNLGKKAGTIYVTIQKSGQLESSKTKVNFKKEK